MIYFRSLSLARGATGVRATDAAPSALLRSRGGLFVVCVIVLTASSLWFSGTEGAADVMSGSLREQVLWGVVYLGAVIGIFRCRGNLRELLRGSLPIIAIMVLALVSTMWSTDPGITLKRAIGLWGTSAFAYYVASRFSLREFIAILGVACYATAILSLLAILLAPSIGVTQSYYAGAWRGIFFDKNYLGEFMVLSLLTFGIIILSRSWPRHVTLIGAALSAVLLLGSESVSALVISATLLIAAALMALWLQGARGRFIALALGVSALLIGLGLYAYGVDSQALLDAVGRDQTLTGRTDLWPQVVQAISNHLWLGYGYGAFWLPNGDMTYFISSGWTPAHAHNGYLEACLDLGAAGAIVAVLAILVALRRSVSLFGRQLAQCYAWPLLAVIYFMVANLTESSIATYNNFGWIVFVVAFLYASEAAKDPPGTSHARIIPAEPAAVDGSSKLG